MKKVLLLLCFVFVAVLGANAQTLKPKKFKLEPQKAIAARDKRKDAHGQNCAVILVDVVGVGNIKFVEAVGETEYAFNEYKVYVPQNTKRLSYTFGGKNGSINLEKYGVDIESLKTYRLTMETENRLRSAVFYIVPQNATLVFDGKTVALDDNGAVAINKPIGTYNYSITSNGYVSTSGTVSLTEDEINHTENISLEQKKHFVTLNYPVPDATLFIDDEPYGKVSELGSRIQLPEGKHTYRLICENYEDVMGELPVYNEGAILSATAKKLKGKTIKHKEKRTKTEIDIRNSFDVLLSTSTFMEDAFKSYVAHLAFGWNQRFGIFTIREGAEVGLGYASNKYSPTFDKYYEEQTDENKHDAIPLTANIPLQLGVTLPLNKYNSCYAELLGGAYGAYYYTGHKASHLNGSHNSSVSTEKWDWGLRFDALFYFNKLILGFEGSRSLNNHKIGLQLGVKIGYKFAL